VLDDNRAAHEHRRLDARAVAAVIPAWSASRLQVFEAIGRE
jgi:hypothetical protein